MEQIKPNSIEPLSKRVVRGGIWVFALRITNRGLGFIRTIILARLLAPHDFDLLGIAMLAIATLENFSQTGFQAALIQKKENIESYLDTAWTISAIRGIILFLILFLSAPLISKFFNSPQATLIIRIISVNTLLSGFRNIGILFFQKELEFNKKFFYELTSTLVNLSVAIVLAFILRNVWALVWGGLAASFVRFFMSYTLHSYRPRIRFEKEKFQDLFGFGRWVLGSSILGFLITQGDDIFIGKMIGVTTLAFYQMAYMLSNLPATEITHVISQVTFPAYSKLQKELPKLRKAYLEVLQLTAFVSIPLAGGIFILAPDFTRIFLSEKWMPMVPALQVLALWGIIRSIGATTGPVFQSTGKPEVLTKLQFVVLILLVILIFPLTMQWGILGTSLAVVISSFIPNVIAACMVTKVIQCEGWYFFKRVTIPLINTTIIISFVLILKKYWITSVGIVEFFLIIIFSVLTYFGITYICKNLFGYYEEMFSLFSKKLLRKY